MKRHASLGLVLGFLLLAGCTNDAPPPSPSGPAEANPPGSGTAPVSTPPDPALPAPLLPGPDEIATIDFNASFPSPPSDPLDVGARLAAIRRHWESADDVGHERKVQYQAAAEWMLRLATADIDRWDPFEFRKQHYTLAKSAGKTDDEVAALFDRLDADLGKHFEVRKAQRMAKDAKAAAQAALAALGRAVRDWNSEMKTPGRIREFGSGIRSLADVRKPIQAALKALDQTLADARLLAGNPDALIAWSRNLTEQYGKRVGEAEEFIVHQPR